jgi:histidinol-phosphate aminotransferase
VQACIKRNADDRQEFLNQANARMLKGFDSQTNFFMVNAAMPAGPVIEQLAARGVLVAPPIARYDTYVRVSLGTRADMDAFWRAWDEIVRMTM